MLNTRSLEAKVFGVETFVDGDLSEGTEKLLDEEKMHTSIEGCDSALLRVKFGKGIEG